MLICLYFDFPEAKSTEFKSCQLDLYEGYSFDKEPRFKINPAKDNKWQRIKGSFSLKSYKVLSDESTNCCWMISQ